MHPQWKDIIGSGIIAAHLEKIRNTKDPNRGNAERVDYVFYRVDNTFCRVHPGTKRENDAQLYFADTTTCSRAVEVHEVAPHPLTFQAEWGKRKRSGNSANATKLPSMLQNTILSSGGYSLQT